VKYNNKPTGQILKSMLIHVGKKNEMQPNMNMLIF